MQFPSKETVERIRRQYPVGTRVELVKMDDPQAPSSGTKGTVAGVDDAGSLLMHWDNGSGLNAVYGEDIVKKLENGGADMSENMKQSNTGIEQKRQQLLDATGQK